MNPVYVDTTGWYALTIRSDPWHARAASLLTEHQARLVTSDMTLLESWTLLRLRRGLNAADELIARILGRNLADIISVEPRDIWAALDIRETFSDQDFSLVDRTSWVLMERFAIAEAISFDDDFSVYRYGPHRDKAFTVHR